MVLLSFFLIFFPVLIVICGLVVLFSFLLIFVPVLMSNLCAAKETTGKIREQNDDGLSSTNSNSI